MLRSIDSTQQIGMIYKYDFIENCLRFNDFNNLKKINFLETSNAPMIKPKLFDESEISNNLKDAYKTLENAKNNKLNDLKTSMIPNKAKGLVSLKTIENPTEVKKDLLNSLTGTKNIDDKGKLLGGISRAVTIQNQSLSQQSKLNALRPGMTTSQVASKNKLDSLLGIKKTNQNQDEVNEAFKRINERKNADATGSKLFKGIEYSSESVTFDSLAKKIDNVTDEPKNVEDKVIEVKNDIKQTTSIKINSLIDNIKELKIKDKEEEEISKTENLLNKKYEELDLENKRKTDDLEKIDDKNNIDDEAIKTIIRKRSSKVFTKKY